MRIRASQWLLSGTFAVLIVFGGLYVFGVTCRFCGAPSWKVGYYGKFNRVKSIIEEMPEIRIASSWQHDDVTLEDFGFVVTNSSGETVKVDFMEHSPQMALTASADIHAFVRSAFPH